VLSAYLAGSYAQLEDRAQELYVPFDFEDRELLQESIGKTSVVVPQRGPKRELIDLAEQNARHLLEESLLEGDETEERAADPVYELQRQLGLQRVPRALVCFDISHAQGTDTVASCVWFQNGRPLRAEYRKFKIKTVEGVDDFASMREVVTRYFRRRLDESKPLPDLVMVDGGKGQLSFGSSSRRGTRRIGSRSPFSAPADRRARSRRSCCGYPASATGAGASCFTHSAACKGFVTRRSTRSRRFPASAPRPRGKFATHSAATVRPR
jgi:hypothetical protein